MLKYYLLLFLFLPILSHAQKLRTVTIAGVVVDADSAQTLGSVHLRVPISRKGGVTNADGSFRFRVNESDTVVFSSVGYSSFSLVPADSSQEQLSKLIIKLVPQITVLDGVEVKDYIDVSRYLQPKIDSSVDMRRKKPIRIYEEEPTREGKAVSISGGPNGAQLTGALTAFANLFNDDFQQQKKLKEILAIEEAQAQEKALQRAMTEKYHAMLSAAVQLSEPDIERFTRMYMPPSRRMLHMSDYEVMESIIFYLGKFEPQNDFLQDILENGTFEGDDIGETYYNKGRRPSPKKPK